MSAVFLTTMGTLYSGSGINVNAVTVGEDGWIYLAGIDYGKSPSYEHSLTVMAYKDGQLTWKQDFHDKAFGSFEALTFKNGAVYAAGAISTEFNTADLTASDGSTVSAPEKKAIDPALKALYDPKNPWFFRDPTYPIYVKLNGETGQVELAKVLPSPYVQADDRLRSISVDSENNVYVGGGGWNPGPNPNDSFSNADFYWYIRKFSTAGDQLWKQSAEVVSVDPLTDNLYLTRYQDQMVQLDPANGNDKQVFSSGLTYHPKDVSHWVRGWTYDAAGNLYVLAGRQFWDSKISDFSDQHGILVKVDTTSGKVAWTTPFGMSADSCLPNSITFAPDGNLLVGGQVVGTLEGKVGFGGTDGFLMEFDPSTGSIVSTEVIGTSSYESISQIQYQSVLDKSSGVVIDNNMIIGGSFGAHRYSLEGHDEKDIYLITDQGFTLIGNALDNHIQGGGGDDSISAGIGNDELVGGLGTDTLDGGTGYDVASYESSKASVTIDLKKGTASGIDIGSDKLKNIEEVSAGSGNDILFASDVGNQLDGGAGNDTLTGGKGIDELLGGAGNDRLDGGAGFDCVNYETSTSSITANLKTGIASGTDIGSDTLKNIEEICAGSGNDTLIAADTGSQLEGGAGNDQLNGGLKTDTLYGGDGNDIIDAGAGDDLIIGGDGAGDDIYKGGAGTDTVKYISALSGIRVDLSTTVGTATSIESNDASHIGSDQLFDIENIIAGNYADTLIGSSSANNLSGEDGNDEIVGNAGNDTLTGGNGSDTLNGGFGNDSMTGGLGDDTYMVDSASDKVIENANQGNDTIQTTLSSYTLSANFENLFFIGSAAFKGTGNTAANVISGGSGNDTLMGGTGIDTFNITAGTDSITDFGVGGAEILTVSSGAIANVTVAAGWTATSASSNSGTANLSTKGFAVNLSAIRTGSGFSVTNTGAAAQITGSAFADTLTGAAGNDSLSGGLSNDRLIGGKGVDNLTGGSGSDTFIFSQGDTGQVVGKFDIISDFSKGATGTGDLIDYSKDLMIGGSAASSNSTEALINQSNGVASFAAGSGTTLTDALSDITSRFTKAVDNAGECAFFKVNNTGDYFLFISDGVKGLGANDLVVQLTGISDISSIDLTGGNLTLIG